MRSGWLLLVPLGGALASPGCAGAEPVEPEPGPRGVALEVIASGLQLPVHLAAPAGDDRLFVVEQAGRIRIIRHGQLLARPFLDIRERVLSGGERGLLSVAFHPQYASNGLLYVNYTGAGGHTQVERYRASADPDSADAGSALLVLTFEQPFGNHNGGLVVFGPDGMLWIGSGDGGSGGDPLGHGQDAGSLLGALLRIDVDAAGPYAIPADNPYAAGGGAPEVWAYGLRNPWRFSIDHETGLLYTADVGQNRLEEVNVMPAGAAGLNYGWAIMEGSECFGQATCNQEGLVLPAYEYPHALGCSVTGGHVYRGSAVPDLVGRYVFGDYCQGWIRSFRFDDGRAQSLLELPVGRIGNITSFGEDAHRELYALTADGRVYRFVPAER
jgi:glucose/arabinose dehydrogenase